LDDIASPGIEKISHSSKGACCCMLPLLGEIPWRWSKNYCTIGWYGSNVLDSGVLPQASTGSGQGWNWKPSLSFFWSLHWHTFQEDCFKCILVHWHGIWYTEEYYPQGCCSLSSPGSQAVLAEQFLYSIGWQRCKCLVLLSICSFLLRSFLSAINFLCRLRSSHYSLMRILHLWTAGSNALRGLSYTSLPGMRLTRFHGRGEDNMLRASLSECIYLTNAEWVILDLSCWVLVYRSVSVMYITFSYSYE
jgi:hypothetical protein